MNNSSYITEYISMSGEQREIKLSHAVYFSKEMQRYALLQDTFTLHTDNGTLLLAGVIKKIENDFYLTFDNSDLDSSSNYTASITYLVSDSFSLYEETVLPTIENANNVFVEEESTSYLSIDTTQYITKNIDYVASQYRESNRLKSVISATLEQLQESFTIGGEIPKILNLEWAYGFYLDLIGKIVGVNRHYCGNFKENIAYSLNVYKENLQNTTAIELDDDCMRKLIKVKIVKNRDKVVNYKELSEIISIFLEREINFEDVLPFEIGVDVGEIDDRIAKCLILLRAFLPLPPTIRLNYIESMSIDFNEDTILATDGHAEDSGVLKAPDIIIKSSKDTILATDGYAEGSGNIKEIN